MRKRIVEVVAVAMLVAALGSSGRAVAHHDRDGRMSRRQWIEAVLDHTQGVSRVELRAIWRHPQWRQSMPVTAHTSQTSNPMTVPLRGTGGCHVSSTRWEYGYGIALRGTIPVFTREPLFRYTLHRTWTFDGARVSPRDEWDTDFIVPFADLRWNFDGAFDIENFFVPVDSFPQASHMHSRKGRFGSILQLGGATTDMERWILGKWHGGWETPGHEAPNCGDS